MTKMGIANYNKECRQIVMRYSNEWEVSTTDFDLPADIVFVVNMFVKSIKPIFCWLIIFEKEWLLANITIVPVLLCKF